MSKFPALKVQVVFFMNKAGGADEKATRQDKRKLNCIKLKEIAHLPEVPGTALLLSIGRLPENGLGMYLAVIASRNPTVRNQQNLIVKTGCE